MILIIGGTGMVGGEVVRLLSQQGVPARALVRDPSKAPHDCPADQTKTTLPSGRIVRRPPM